MPSSRKEIAIRFSKDTGCHLSSGPHTGSARFSLSYTFVRCLLGTGAMPRGAYAGEHDGHKANVTKGKRRHRAGSPNLLMKFADDNSPFPNTQTPSPPSSLIPGKVKVLKGPAVPLPHLAWQLPGASDPAPTCQQEVARWHSSLRALESRASL